MGQTGKRRGECLGHSSTVAVAKPGFLKGLNKKATHDDSDSRSGVNLPINSWVGQMSGRFTIGVGNKTVRGGSLMSFFYELCPGITIEELGSDTVVLLGDRKTSLHVSGDSAAWIVCLRDGKTAPEPAQPLIEKMMAAGIVREVSGNSLSRRNALVGAGMVAGSAFALLSLPAPAQASSRIPVSGIWLGTESVVSFFVLGYDFPDVGDSPTGSPAPSGLALGEETYDVVSWRSSLTGAVDGDVILWQLSSSNYPFVQFASESRTLEATFRWAGISYVGTFEYTPI